MIQMFHVHKDYAADSHALNDVSLQIDKGDFVFLTGPSGAGKTTLMRLVFCAELPTRGQLLVNGHNISRLKPSAIPFLRRNIGVVFQDFKLLPRRTVEENVAIALEVLGIGQKETRERTYSILRQVGLAHKLHVLPAKLSGGEQQRVAIARALVNDPQILLADEPTGNLDPERATEIMQLLQEANIRGTTVVVATHDKHLLHKSERRVIRLQSGRVVES